MKQTINFSQFHDAFRNMDRLDNFSYQGLRVLYDWFDDYDEIIKDYAIKNPYRASGPE